MKNLFSAERLEKIIKESEMEGTSKVPPGGPLEAPEKLEEFVVKGLEIIRRLHAAAIKKADAIIEEDKGLESIPRLDETLEKELIELVSRSEEQTVRSLIRTFRSLHKCFSSFSDHSEEMANKVTSQKIFEDERDGKSIRDTAAALQLLRSTSKYKKRFLAAGHNIGEGVTEGVKLVMLKDHKLILGNIEGQLLASQVHLALSKKAAEGASPLGWAPERGPQGAPADGGDAKEVFLKEQEKILERVKLIAQHLHENIGVLRESKTLADAFSAFIVAAKPGREAISLLRRFDEVENELVDYNKGFDKESDLRVQEALLKYLHSLWRESTGMGEAVKKVRNSLKRTRVKVKRGYARSHLQLLNKSIFKKLRDEGEAALQRTTDRFENTLFTMQEIKKGKNVDVLQRLTQLKTNVIMQTVEKGHVQMLQLASQLFAFLEKDINYSLTQASLAAAKIVSLPGPWQERYKKLRLQFNAAKENTKTAQKLVDAAEAAAEMREIVVAMRELLFASKKAKKQN